jgi:type VI secretion system protein ImpA
MNSNLVPLLAPLSEEHPTGPDLTYDPALHELEELLLGKPETQFSPAESPDWKRIYEHSIWLLEKTKDLRPAIALARAALERDGLPGFADGLELLAELLNRFWPILYPAMDAELDKPSQERLNLLYSLAVPEGTVGDPYQFITRVRRVPVAHSPRLGDIHLAELRPSVSQPAAADKEENSPISAAFLDTPEEYLRAVGAAAEHSLLQLHRIEEFLESQLPPEQTLKFDSLTRILREIPKQIAQFSPSKIEPFSTTDSKPGEPALSPTAVPVRSRDDVLQMLALLCDYYRRIEPSSPLLTILQQAQTLVGKSFPEILAELAPDSTAQIKLK